MENSLKSSEQGLSTATKSSPLRVAMASFVGTAVEYYDFFIYGTAAALVFPRLFFPGTDPALGILLSFATFGVGFLARPLGGVLFGHFGDRVGRKRMLVLSLIGMGSATVLIGLMPTYAQIGIAAPLILTLLRLFQGVAVGGEWGGATLMAVEHAPPGRKGYFGAFPMMGAPAGSLLAAVAFISVSQLPDDAFLSWGWRLPFLFSAVLIVVGLVIRLAVDESPDFKNVRKSDAIPRMPVILAFKKHWREILLVAGTYLSQGVFVYLSSAYMVSYATAEAGLTRSQALVGVFVASVFSLILLPFFGALSDRSFSRKTIYLASVLAAACVAPIVFALVNTGNVVLYVLAQVLLSGVALAPAAAVSGSLFTMVFSADVRYSGVSVGYTLSQVLGSAFAPMIAAALLTATGTSTSIVIYMLAVSVISIVSVILLPGGWGRAGAKDQVTRDEHANKTSSNPHGR